MDDIQIRLRRIEELLNDLKTRRVGKNNIIPGSIQQPHLAGNTGAIIFDKAANRPSAGSNYALAFFATDTNVLSIWNNNAWKSVTLS